MSRNAIFDGLDFAVYGLVITRVRGLHGRTRLVTQREPRASADGEVSVSHRFTGKQVVLEGFLKRDTLEELEQAIDDLNAVLGGPERVLDITYGSGWRRFIATADNVVIEPQVTVADFSFEFTAPAGYGSDLLPVALLDPVSFTTSSQSININIEGSYKAQPSITLNLTTAVSSDVPPQQVTFRNPENSSQVSVFGEFQDGDVVTIDCGNKRAYLNLSEAPTAGAFPHWESGPGVLAYSDDLDSRNGQLSGTYTRRYS